MHRNTYSTNTTVTAKHDSTAGDYTYSLAITASHAQEQHYNPKHNATARSAHVPIILTAPHGQKPHIPTTLTTTSAQATASHAQAQTSRHIQHRTYLNHT